MDNNAKEAKWAKVLFRQVGEHFLPLLLQNEEQAKEAVFNDIKESLIALNGLSSKGSSFGAMMVKLAEERMEGEQATKARENGRFGGRPKFANRIPAPRSMEEVAKFADEHELDYNDARTWFARNYEERDGIDKDGNEIMNWKGALINECKAEASKRNKSKGISNSTGYVQHSYKQKVV